jgi:hypothetical protein
MSYEDRTEARLKRVETEGEEIGQEIVGTMQTLYASFLDLLETMKEIAGYSAPVPDDVALKVVRLKALGAVQRNEPEE